MKTTMKVILIFCAALQFASCGKKTDGEEKLVNENVPNTTNIVNVSDTTNASDFLNVLDFVFLSDTVTERRKQGKLWENGIVIEYIRDEDSYFIFYCNVYHDTSPASYHYNVSISVNQSGFAEYFKKESFNEDTQPTRRYQAISSLFDYGIFLGHLKEFLLNNNETEEDAGFIIDLLSRNESNLMLDPEQRKAKVLEEANNRPPLPRPRIGEKVEIRKDGIVISYEKNGNDFIIYCDIFNDNPNRTVPYYYNMYIYKSSRENILWEYFEKMQLFVVTAPMYFSQPVSSFDFDIFVEHLKIYLTENDENNMNIDTMLGLLSGIKDDVLSSLEYFK